jgi:2-polyprenyl-6-methoxyphenol hydroxylase-like FAD-dependent oxidoreductase
MTTGPADVLVVGAGPTGLALALQAHDHGAHVRVVERRSDPLRPSRALVMHPRTLEVLRPLGITDALLDRGDVSPTVHLHLGSRVIPVQLSDLDLPDSAFPHLLLIRQNDVEAVLAEALADRGIKVERGVSLEAVLDDVASLRHAGGGVEEARFSFLAGCDGAHSTVRTLAGIGWRGGAYRQEVLLADVELDGDLAPGVAHVVPRPRGLLFVFAIGERATWRLLATRERQDDDLPFSQPGPPVATAELQELLDDAGLAARITDVAWSARVPLQHRIASAYRRGRLFLVGDAAHVHSPAAAQGMNAGIQDAVNLGWKLAFGSELLLDSYERERRPVAQQVLALTHTVFWAEAGTDPLAAFARGVLAPLGAPAVPFLLGRRRLVAAGVRLLSQLHVQYRRSALSVSGTPGARVGDRPGERLPDSEVTLCGRSTRLHAVLAAPGVHVLLARDAAQPPPLGELVAVHRVTSWPGSAVVAVRPDGYVGYRSADADPAALQAWLSMLAR